MSNEPSEPDLKHNTENDPIQKENMNYDTSHEYDLTYSNNTDSSETETSITKCSADSSENYQFESHECSKSDTIVATDTSDEIDKIDKFDHTDKSNKAESSESISMNDDNKKICIDTSNYVCNKSDIDTDTSSDIVNNVNNDNVIKSKYDNNIVSTDESGDNKKKQTSLNITTRRKIATCLAYANFMYNIQLFDIVNDIISTFTSKLKIQFNKKSITKFTSNIQNNCMGIITKRNVVEPIYLVILRGSSIKLHDKHAFINVINKYDTKHKIKYIGNKIYKCNKDSPDDKYDIYRSHDTYSYEQLVLCSITNSSRQTLIEITICLDNNTSLTYDCNDCDDSDESNDIIDHEKQMRNKILSQKEWDPKYREKDMDVIYEVVANYAHNIILYHDIEEIVNNIKKLSKKYFKKDNRIEFDTSQLSTKKLSQQFVDTESNNKKFLELNACLYNVKIDIRSQKKLPKKFFMKYLNEQRSKSNYLNLHTLRNYVKKRIIGKNEYIMYKQVLIFDIDNPDIEKCTLTINVHILKIDHKNIEIKSRQTHNSLISSGKYVPDTNNNNSNEENYFKKFMKFLKKKLLR